MPRGGKRKYKDDIDAFCANTISRLKASCRKRPKDITVSLTIEEVRSLIFNNCFYCDSKPSNKRTIGKITMKCSGLDRIDSDDGYHLHNVVPCCFKCNCAKGDGTIEELKEWVSRLYKNLL